MVKLILDVYLNKRKISRYKLSKDGNIAYPTVDDYYKNNVVRYDSDVLDRICKALNCDISDIMIFENDADK